MAEDEMKTATAPHSCGRKARLVVRRGRRASGVTYPRYQEHTETLRLWRRYLDLACSTLCRAGCGGSHRGPPRSGPRAGGPSGETCICLPPYTRGGEELWCAVVV
jgi:hypothetical protein